MIIQHYRHNPSPPAARPYAIAFDPHDRQNLTLIRLLCTSMLTALILTGSAIYSRASSAETPAVIKTETTTQASPETTNATQNVANGLVYPDYLDDRSTPQKLIESYYNAINRKEYVRAYSYYAEGTPEPDFSKYAQGYKDTQSVTIKLGSTEPDPGAGQIYWTLPLAIQSTRTDGKSEVYTGCYTISMTNPAMQELPPFKPMTISTGTLSKSPKTLEESVPVECEAP